MLIIAAHAMLGVVCYLHQERHAPRAFLFQAANQFIVHSISVIKTLCWYSYHCRFYH